MSTTQTSGLARAAWNPQTQGSARKGVPGERAGEAVSPGVNPRCDYAHCDKPRVWRANGWWFCGIHYLEHCSLFRGEKWPHKYLRQDAATKYLDMQPCGTEAATARHRRNGERCAVCIRAGEDRHTEAVMGLRRRQECA